MNKMKKLVMIVGAYYPNPSPTGKVADQYISLIKDQYDISVICIGKNKDNKEYNFRYKKVYELANWRNYRIHYFTSIIREKKNLFIKAFLKLIVLCMKGYGKIQTLLFCNNNLRWFYTKSFKTLKKINKKEGIDVVFSVSAPFSSHLAARKFKLTYPSVRWVSFTVDSFSAQNRSSLRYNRILKTEKKILQISDLNFASYDIIKVGAVFNDCHLVAKELPYLLEIHDDVFNKRKEVNHNCIKLVYAGRFYLKLREPDFMLKVISCISKVKLSIYSEGQCETIINNYSSQSKTNIKRYNMVPIDVMEAIYNDSDVFVSVGNNSQEFQPSKIYEYIAMGKPVIHFYYSNHRDSILDKYPLALQIEIGDSEAKNKIELFLNEKIDERISSDNIRKIYANNMEDRIKELLLSSM